MNQQPQTPDSTTTYNDTHRKNVEHNYEDSNNRFEETPDGDVTFINEDTVELQREKDRCNTTHPSTHTIKEDKVL